MNKVISRNAMTVGAGVLSYLAIFSFVLAILHARSPRWALFIDVVLQWSRIRIVFVAGAIAIVVGLLYWKRTYVLGILKTNISRLGLLLAVAAGGLHYRLNTPELIVLLYAAYSFMFIKESLEKNKLRQLVDIFVFNVESRTPAFFALFLIICIPIGLIFKRITFAENIAVYAYCFLIIAVTLHILEMKWGIEKGNQLNDFLGHKFQELFHTVADKKRRTLLISVVSSYRTRFAMTSTAIYVFVFLGILVVMYKAKSNYWKRIESPMNANADYLAEVSLLGAPHEIYTFPAFTDTILVPIRVKHPASYPLWWQNSGPGAVNIGVQWFPANHGEDMTQYLYMDSQPLPRALFITESANIQFPLRRPLIPTGRSYEARIGLISNGEFWSAVKSDDYLKLRIFIDSLSGKAALSHEIKMRDYLLRKKEDTWSQQLASSKNVYHSKIEQIGLAVPGSSMTVTVTNTGDIPWPVHNADPVRVGVVGVGKLEGEKRNRYIHLFEEKSDLGNVISPGDKTIVKVFIDPIKTFKADELWIGMVHENKSWFYMRGDSVLKVKLFRSEQSNLFEQQLAVLKEKNLRLVDELSRNIALSRMSDGTARYRSKIWALNYRSEKIIETDTNGLNLELAISNTGDMPWPVRLHNESEQVTVPAPVNLGILWFREDTENPDYSNRISEERYSFPFTMLTGTTIRLQCKIGGQLKPGDYVVWIGPVQEGVTWFYEQGDDLLKLSVKIR